MRLGNFLRGRDKTQTKSSEETHVSDDATQEQRNSSLQHEVGATKQRSRSARQEGQPDTADEPDTSALNDKIVQAVGFSNSEVARYRQQLVMGPPESMVSQAAGLAVQDAATYMNAIMQVALAAQSVIAKKAAEGPAEAIEEAPALAEIQKMVSSAVEIYSSVSQAAGSSAKSLDDNSRPEKGMKR